MSSSINWIFLWTLAIQNHFEQPIAEKRRNKAKYLSWNSITLKSVKKASMPNSAESLGYVKCYSWSSPRSVKNSSNSIKNNWKKIYNWSGRPKTILKIRKKTTFSRWSTILLFIRFSKTLLTTERRLTGRWFLAVDRSSTFLNTGTTDETFQQFEKQDSFRNLLKSSTSM